MKSPLERAIDICVPLNESARHGKFGVIISKFTLKKIGQAHVWNWLNRCKGLVPPEYCAAIELATEGAVTRQELRPDDWQVIWPELVPCSSELNLSADKCAA